MRTKSGVVTSTKMNKTIVIKVEYSKLHPLYKKAMKKHHKFYAHDPEEKYAVGDEVTVYETNPISKSKRWTVIPPQETPAKKAA